jgi:hypothetical protein
MDAPARANGAAVREAVRQNEQERRAVCSGADPISALPAGCTSTNEVLCLQWLLPFSARCFPNPWRGIGWSRRIKI